MTTELNPELLQLARQHADVIRMAVARQGFRYTMPEGGTEAIHAGLVAQADPTWHYSDDPRASNGFNLTDLGNKAAHALGLTCQCHGCFQETQLRGWNPATAIQDYCPRCGPSIQQYGTKEYEGQLCCGFHARLLPKLTQEIHTSPRS